MVNGGWTNYPANMIMKRAFHFKFQVTLQLLLRKWSESIFKPFVPRNVGGCSLIRTHGTFFIFFGYFGIFDETIARYFREKKIAECERTLKIISRLFGEALRKSFFFQSDIIISKSPKNTYCFTLRDILKFWTLKLSRFLACRRDTWKNERKKPRNWSFFIYFIL